MSACRPTRRWTATLKTGTPMIQRILFFTIIVLSVAMTVDAQETNRLVDWPAVSPRSDAKVLEIIRITVKDTNVTPGQYFAAADDWLNKLTFRIRNVSDKTITRCGFGIGFPELSPGGGGMPGFSIVYDTEKKPEKLQPIPPGAEVEVTLPADQLEIMRQAAIRLIGTSHLTRIRILPGLATFADGSDIGGFSLRKN
jgi:hypothetical protein